MSPPARRSGDAHALEVKQRLDKIERRVDDLLLTARVIALMIGGNALLHLFDGLLPS